jgi:hypothetical protein
LIRITKQNQVSFFLAEARQVAEKSWQHHLVDLPLDTHSARRELLETLSLEGVMRCCLGVANAHAPSELGGN